MVASNSSAHLIKFFIVLLYDPLVVQCILLGLAFVVLYTGDGSCVQIPVLGTLTP